MEKYDLGKYQPSCHLAHGLVNQLTVIIGYCDLMAEASEESKRTERLAMMRQLAAKMAAALRDHQCQLEAVAKMLAKKAPESAKGAMVQSALEAETGA